MGNFLIFTYEEKYLKYQIHFTDNWENAVRIIRFSLPLPP